MQGKALQNRVRYTLTCSPVGCRLCQVSVAQGYTLQPLFSVDTLANSTHALFQRGCLSACFRFLFSICFTAFHSCPLLSRSQRYPTRAGRKLRAFSSFSRVGAFVSTFSSQPLSVAVLSFDCTTIIALFRGGKFRPVFAILSSGGAVCPPSFDCINIIPQKRMLKNTYFFTYGGRLKLWFFLAYPYILVGSLLVH